MGDNFKHLGSGTYGSVHLDKGLAIKVFKSDSKARTMMIEIVASIYLRGCPNILKITKFNLLKKYHASVYHDDNLKDIMKRGRKYTIEQKKEMIESLLYGVLYMHNRGITHGDLKPSNIFYDGTKFIIGDLGFTTPSLYSKVDKTARYYREPKLLASPSHDMYSLGIILLEFFCNIRIKKNYDYEELLKKASKCEDPIIKHAITTLVTPNPDNRLSCKSLYFMLYGKNIEYNKIDRNRVKIKRDLNNLLENFSILNRQVFQLVCNYLETEDQFKIYCLMYIFASIFGGNISIERIKKIFRKSENTIYTTITSMISDSKLCEILYS